VTDVKDELALQASTRTLAHYEQRAAAFWEGTRDHDVSQNLDALLSAFPDAEPGRPLRILDFGCGPGRDLAELRHRGHQPTGLDGCESFVQMARAHAGVTVLQQDFHALDLPPGAFDGVFANASLFHVPTALLPGVLAHLFAALVPGGALFCSNPRARDGSTAQEGFVGERYASHLDLESWRALFRGAGFVEIRHYYRPEGLPRAEQPWLAMLWRRPSS
jgi:SAM-dependent methyltransferase